METGSVALTNDALLEFASGQIGTIDGYLALVGANARVADAGTLASNSALTGLGTVAGDLLLSAGASVSTTGGLSIIGNGEVWVDSPFNDGLGGSSLTVGGTLAVSSTNGNALYIGASNISTGDTVTATGLVNTGVIEISGNGTIQSTLDITSGAAGFGTLGVETGSVALTNDALLEFASGQIGTIDGVSRACRCQCAGRRRRDPGQQQRADWPRDGRRGSPAVGRSVGQHHGRAEHHRQR